MVIHEITRWAAVEAAVSAVAIVGSYARGAERMGSDVDVVILSSEPDRLAEDRWFRGLFPGARLVRSMSWGPVRERRMRLRSGLQVELNYAPLSWAAIPLDAGTRRVLGDGHRIISDTGLLGPAVETLGQPG